jgi:hypothetical protein
MAKIHGSYKAIYEMNSRERYIMEITGSLAVVSNLSDEMNEADKDGIWSDFIGSSGKFDPRKR